MAVKRINTKTDPVKILESLTRDLVSKMGSKAEVEIEEDKANNALLVNLKSDEETGLLIGKQGESLNAIQTVLGIMLRQRCGEWKRVIVNIADWREKQEDYLRSLALTSIERLKETGEAQSLYNLTPSQRRVVHMVVSKAKGVVSESQGDGDDRYLVIKNDESKK